MKILVLLLIAIGFCLPTGNEALAQRGLAKGGMNQASGYCPSGWWVSDRGRCRRPAKVVRRARPQ